MGKGLGMKESFKRPLSMRGTSLARFKRGVILRFHAVAMTSPRKPLPPPLKASQRGLMRRAEATRWRRPRPLGLGRGGTGARPLRVGRSSCGRCSIGRRPAPVLRSGSPVSWGRDLAPSPRPLNPAPLGSASQEMPLCSAVPPLFQICSSALEHGFAPAFIGLAHAFLSFVPDK